jgi:hypothetical protein
MQYRVLWSPYAEEQLEQLFAESTERFASVIADAVREIDGLLLDSPDAFGESRYDAMRIGFVNPLGVDFEVIDDLRTVVVHDVWRITRHN